jgi:hypothetical protein
MLKRHLLVVTVAHCAGCMPARAEKLPTRLCVSVRSAAAGKKSNSGSRAAGGAGLFGANKHSSKQFQQQGSYNLYANAPTGRVSGILTRWASVSMISAEQQQH